MNKPTLEQAMQMVFAALGQLNLKREEHVALNAAFQVIGESLPAPKVEAPVEASKE
jgi:hypothetical protein